VQHDRHQHQLIASIPDTPDTSTSCLPTQATPTQTQPAFAQPVSLTQHASPSPHPISLPRSLGQADSERTVCETASAAEPSEATPAATDCSPALVACKLHVIEGSTQVEVRLRAAPSLGESPARHGASVVDAGSSAASGLARCAEGSAAAEAPQRGPELLTDSELWEYFGEEDCRPIQDGADASALGTCPLVHCEIECTGAEVRLERTRVRSRSLRLTRAECAGSDAEMLPERCQNTPGSEDHRKCACGLRPSTAMCSLSGKRRL
jgi:hypothetical protein